MFPGPSAGGGWSTGIQPYLMDTRDGAVARGGPGQSREESDPAPQSWSWGRAGSRLVLCGAAWALMAGSGPEVCAPSLGSAWELQW